MKTEAEGQGQREVKEGQVNGKVKSTSRSSKGPRCNTSRLPPDVRVPFDDL
jgi:hypothetical protein